MAETGPGPAGPAANGDRVATEDLADDAAGMARAAELLRAGGVVVIPTETVFGLGADATNPEAVAGIYRAKGRPADNPLIVHVADQASVGLAAGLVRPEEALLLATFAPGPLTLILPRSPGLAPAVTAGLDTVGVRIPSHPVARAVLRLAGVPVAAPSANRSGRPSPTDFAMAWEEMEGRADGVLRGESSTVGLESTIAWLDRGLVHVLRPGAIAGSALVRVLHDSGFSYALAPSGQGPAHHGGAGLGGDDAIRGRPVAPGTRYRHYSPRARVQLWLPGKPPGAAHGTDPGVPVDDGTVGVIGTVEALERAGLAARGAGAGGSADDDGERTGPFRVVLAARDAADLARNLYRFLVEADHRACTEVWLWLEPPRDALDPLQGLVEALRDRCRRAAGLVEED